MSKLSIRLLAKFVIMAMRQGFYATRQHLLKNGYSMNDVGYVLACTLRHQGLEGKE